MLDLVDVSAVMCKYMYLKLILNVFISSYQG